MSTRTIFRQNYIIEDDYRNQSQRAKRHHLQVFTRSWASAYSLFSLQRG
jgi:hypothetical protein